jgi:hypothetical protein
MPAQAGIQNALNEFRLFSATWIDYASAIVRTVDSEFSK